MFSSRRYYSIEQLNRAADSTQRVFRLIERHLLSQTLYKPDGRAIWQRDFLAAGINPYSPGRRKRGASLRTNKKGAPKPPKRVVWVKAYLSAAWLRMRADAAPGAFPSSPNDFGAEYFRPGWGSAIPCPWFIGPWRRSCGAEGSGRGTNVYASF